MDCFDDNIAVELFDGALSPELEADVEAHAASCSDCRQLLAELARSPSMLGVSPTIPATPGDAHIDLSQGDKVGRFSILHRIGHGGMGVVFSAYDSKLDRKVALKLIRSTEASSVTPDEAQARLLREAQAIAQQSHPNVISLYDVGTYKSEVYIAMELVEGTTLRTWLRQWKRPWPDILDKFRQAGDALTAAHGTGLVHRDFKPENALVGHDERVRVMDFGLARSLFYDAPAARETFDPDFRVAIDGVSELNRTLTKTGALLGTPRYMAPEQFLGGEADARSDQFSFCVALWEALYREHPFEGGTARRLVDGDEVVLRSRPRGKIPAWIHRAMVRGLDREPAARWPSMRSLMQALKAPTRKRRPLWLTTAAVTLGLLAMGLAAYAYTLHRDRAAADEHAERMTLARNAAFELATKRDAELVTLRTAVQTMRVERDDLYGKLEESLEAVSRLPELERMIIEAEEQILRLEQVVRKPRPSRSTPRTAPEVGLRIGTVRRAVNGRMTEIKSCFSEWRERQPARDVKVLVRFEIQPDSSVALDDVLGTADRVLRLCLTGILTEVPFPTSDGVTVVDYRFDTSPTRFVHSARVTERRRPD